MSDDKASVIHGDEGGLTEDDAGLTLEILEGLGKLREPFPAEMIEKLPKPRFKNAWEGKRGSNCPECHGYHVLDDCIHLDYVGHANTTNRLLEADPFWTWEPMAYTEAGTPLFSDGGLWIRLTVCGVERIGYGDGKTVKEVIGDAIRNAGMRFGVALNLWAKVDLHAERNPGDGETPQRRAVAERGVRDRGQESRDSNSQRRNRPAADRRDADQPAPEPSRAPNQDALDTLGEGCDENGIPRKGIKQQYLNWAAKSGRAEGDLLLAPTGDIEAFILHILESFEPPDSGNSGAGVADDAEEDTDSGGPVRRDADDPAAPGGDAEGVGEVGSSDDVTADSGCAWCGGEHEGGPENCAQDTSDVEKQDGDLF